MFDSYLERQQRFRSLRALPPGALAVAGTTMVVAAVVLDRATAGDLGAVFAFGVMILTMVAAGLYLIVAELVRLSLGPPRTVDRADLPSPLPAARARLRRTLGRGRPQAWRAGVTS